jgi:feruloyl esterase
MPDSKLQLALALYLAWSVPAHAGCESLIGFSYPDTTVTSAVSVPGPTFTAPDGQTYESVPPFCRVTATLTPTTDSLINIEVWMPEGGWSGRFLGVGNGGYAGNYAVAVPAMVSALQLGFATATTDMGTAPSANSNADVLVGHPQKWIDWGHRATHLMTVVSRQIVQTFYGQGPRYAYFHGCSTGGQQALMEAQRYWDDYDGILAGAPANNRTHVHTSVVWLYQATHKTPGSYIPPDKVQLITSSVVAACNVKSGGLATDAFLTDARACDWDPASIQCPLFDAPNCLTAEQVRAAQSIYGGPRNPSNGHLIFPGSIRGSENAAELGWNSLQSNPEPSYDSLFKWVFGSAWLWFTYDFDQDMQSVNALLAPILNANSADLGPFRDRGGKLLAYHGWADPIISAQDMVNYYHRVAARMHGSPAQALRRTQEFFRLFMVPGMGHCSRGAGPNAFGNPFSARVVAPPAPADDPMHNILLALVEWVERGVAPERMVATKYVQDAADMGVQMTRPLCPYPQIPRYSGSGDPSVAESFVCAQGPSVSDPTAAPEYLQ